MQKICSSSLINVQISNELIVLFILKLETVQVSIWNLEHKNQKNTFISTIPNKEGKSIRI